MDISKKTLLLLHWFTCSIGLTGILYGLSRKLNAARLAETKTIAFHDWAINFFNSNKPQEQIFYLAAGISLFLYYLVVLLIFRKGEKWLTNSYTLAEYGSLKFLGLYITVPVVLNLIVLIWFPSGANSSIPIAGYFFGLLWLSILFLPLYESLNQIREILLLRQVRERLYRVLEIANACVQRQLWFWAVVGLVVLICFQFIAIFLPYVRGELLMINEYMDIPEYTRMGEHEVSNADYLRRHNFGGLLKYDPEVDRGNTPPPRPGTFIEVPRTDSLDRFIERHKTDYYYHEELGVLVIQRAMLPWEQRELAMVFDQAGDQAKINWLYFRSNDQSDRSGGAYTAEEQEFLMKNRFELHWQILNRWVLHHHNFVLGPINEYALGKPLREINAQYGLYNVVMMTWLLERTGGISYQNYFQKWYAWWLVYFALFVALAFLLFRSVYYGALVCVLAFGLTNMIDYQFLFLGPGLNPIRHFLDLPVIACLYWYYKSGRSGVLVLALLFGFMGLVNNTQFGVFLIVALVVTVLVKAWQERERSRYLEVRWVAGVAVVLGIILLWGTPGGNIMSQYYRQGFLGFPTNPRVLYLIIFIISGCYLMLLRLEHVANEWKYLALFLLLYSQGLLVYGLWGGTNKHLLNIAPVLVLSGVVFLKLLIDRSRLKKYEQVLVSALLVGALGFVYVPGLFAYYTTKSEYEQVFATHRTYEWNLEKAQFRSTMDPKYFLDSVSLIQQYANSENGIYIISKYDNVLPFLAKKYSAMPFFDVQWVLLTEHEVSLCIERIKAMRPQHLFVDTDIERNLNGEIIRTPIPMLGGLGYEPLSRVQRLNLLKDVFAAVKDEYELEMSSGLLAVYKRKVSVEVGKLP